MSGSLAPGVPVKVSATFTFSGSGSEKKDFEQNSDDSGRVSIPIVIPETIAELQLWVGFLGTTRGGGGEVGELIPEAPQPSLGH